MNSIQLRNPYEIPLYIFSVLVNLLIIALILIGALLLGNLNALAGEPLSGPMVDAIRVAFVALLRATIPHAGRFTLMEPSPQKEGLEADIKTMRSLMAK